MAEFVPIDDVTTLTHGTAIAGIIGASSGNAEGVVGLAPSATMNVYAACQPVDGRPRCNTFTLAQAVEAAIEDDIDILNISLAGPEDRLLSIMLTHANANGMVIIAATHPQDPNRNFPASMDITHAVGSSAPDSRWFANGELFSTQAGGGYRVFFGSSVAAAGMASVAALIRTQCSAADTDATIAKLIATPCSESLRDSQLRGPLCSSPQP